MKALVAIAVSLGLAGVAAAQPQEPTLRDLESKNPRKLSKDEVTQLAVGKRARALRWASGTFPTTAATAC